MGPGETPLMSDYLTWGLLFILLFGFVAFVKRCWG